MDISAIQFLPMPAKRLWLHSKAGKDQMQEWLSEGYSIFKIAAILNIHGATLRMWCKHDVELSEIITCHQEGTQQVDYSAPPAYRLIFDYSSECKRGTILAEYVTAEEVWQNHTIQLYFGSYGMSASDYLNSYLTKINQCGIYRLSHLYCIAYCVINKRGNIKILKPCK